MSQQGTNPKSVDGLVKSGSHELNLANSRTRWIALGDLLAVLSLVGLLIVSVVVITLVFVGSTRYWEEIPLALTIMQTGIATLMLPVFSAVLRLLGQRYIYAQLSNKGLRSRSVANYNDWSVGSALNQAVAARLEPLGILLLLVWLLGLATGFTVRESAKLSPYLAYDMPVALPFGSLDHETFIPSTDSVVPLAAGTISSLASVIETRSEGSFGYINVTNAYAGSVYYPPLSLSLGSFEAPARLNGLQVTFTNLQSIPSTASQLNCTQYSSWYSFWLLRATQTTLSFAYTDNENKSYTQVDSTAVVLGGRLSIQKLGPHPYAEFEANGTTWELTMKDSKWATQLMDIVCTTTVVDTVYSGDNTLLGFARGINQRDMYDTNSGVTSDERIWSTTMGIAIGAFSSNRFNSAPFSPQIYVDMKTDTMVLVPTYGVYILIANTVASAILLLAIWNLYRASPLVRDFMDPTRLLLGPLEDKQLFNATLDETIRQLDDPHLQVTQSQQLLVTRSKGVEHLIPSL
ncbi:hypothetical protein FRC19_010295 [Serendipita sp. 401]|nr:hypothetical protein FRC19_010295 [Serendipita sp. 401]